MLNKRNKSIFIGLSEVAGFGEMYSRGLKSLGYNVDFVISKPDLVKRSYNCDRCLNIQKYPRFIRIIILSIELIKSLLQHNYYIFLYGKSFWPGNYDLPILKLFNKKIITIFLGCEIRQRDAIGKLERIYDPCRDCSIDCRYKIKKHIASMFEKYSDVLLCQPEYDQLLTKKYEYVWVPLDIEEWKPVSKINTTTIKIIHAPSNPEKKGTKYIIQAVEKLKEEGYAFEFFLAEKLTNQELKTHIENCSLVIDQIMIGWYGKLAIETMALGRPVICWIDPSLSQYIPDLPVISANPETIYDTLKNLLDNPDTLIKKGFTSRKYVEKHHNYLNICQDLINYIEGK